MFMSDIYGVGDYIKKTRKLLKHANMSDSNKCYLNEWIDYLLSENSVGEKKIYRYIQTFRVLSAQGAFEFDLKDADKKDVRRLVGKINSNRVQGKTYAPESRAELKKAVRKFYQFVYDEEEPEIIDFISTHVKKKNQSSIDFSSLPTPKDVAKMYQMAKNPRDKAFILILWESGGRIGEILGLKWSDIKDEGVVSDLTLDGKTGERNVKVVDSKPLLDEWKYFQEDSTGHVWTSFQSSKRLSYSGVTKQLDAMADRAGVENRTNPHAFRKSRATFMAHNGARMVDLMDMFGWNKYSSAEPYVKHAKARTHSLILDYSSRQDIHKERIKDELNIKKQKWQYSPAKKIEY